MFSQYYHENLLADANTRVANFCIDTIQATSDVNMLTPVHVGATFRYCV